MTRYEATCSVWFTEDGERIHRIETFEAKRLEGSDGIGGLISSYIRHSFDGEKRVWKCPVIEVKKGRIHHGYYRWVNSSFSRLEYSYQGDSPFARKRRMRDLQNRGYSQLFSVFSDCAGDNKRSYRERTGVCLDELSKQLHESVWNRS